MAITASKSAVWRVFILGFPWSRYNSAARSNSAGLVLSTYAFSQRGDWQSWSLLLKLLITLRLVKAFIRPCVLIFRLHSARALTQLSIQGHCCPPQSTCAADIVVQGSSRFSPDRARQKGDVSLLWNDSAVAAPGSVARTTADGSSATAILSGLTGWRSSRRILPSEL